MAHDLPPLRHLGDPSIFQALEHRNVELGEEHIDRVRDAVHDVQAVLESDLRPMYDAGADGVKELYVAEGCYERGLVAAPSIRDAIFKKAGVTDPPVREAVQHTHKAEAKRTRAYGGSKGTELFVLVDPPEQYAPPAA